jgi:hypothetical protein
MLVKLNQHTAAASRPPPLGIFTKKKFQIVAADTPYRPRILNLKHAAFGLAGAQGWGREKDPLNEFGGHRRDAGSGEGDRPNRQGPCIVNVFRASKG